MAKKKECIPTYGSIVKNGVAYYRTRITDADGKRVDLYATTCEELYKKEKEARRVVEDLIFRKKNPTVADYCEKWLTMHSAKVSAATMRGYTRLMKKYIIAPLGDMYLSDVTADDIRVALVPLARKSANIYAQVNMLIKCVFYSAERNELIDYNPSAGISAKGGIPSKEKEALSDEQVTILFTNFGGAF